jgi:hypothetical protein
MAEPDRQQRTETPQKLYDGKLPFERRNGGSKIYARTYIQGKSATARTCTPGPSAEASIEHADQVREVSEGQRRNYRQKWNLLKPHFDGRKVTDVDARFLAARPRPEPRLSRHSEMGAHQSGDDRRLLRLDASSAKRRAHRRLLK